MMLLMCDICRKTVTCTSHLIVKSAQNFSSRAPHKLQRKPFQKFRRTTKFYESDKRKEASRQGDKSVPIISCKRSEFDHYKGQSYARFQAVPLASKGWHHRQSKGDYFKICKHQENPSTEKYSEDSGPSFIDTGLDDQVVDIINKLGFTQPTNIQALGIPQILSGNNTILAAETGCGKTLAYLAPVIQQVVHQSTLMPATPENTPLALVLSPNRELVYQIGGIAREFSRCLQFSSKILIGGRTKRKMLNPVIQHVDLLIGSLGAVSKLASSKIYDLSLVKHVILDEADTLLDDSFNEKLRYFLRRFMFQCNIPQRQDSHGGVQLTLVGATMPRSLPEILGDVVPYESLVKVTTAQLHCIMPHVPQKFIRLGKVQKPAELLKVIKTDAEKKIPVIIFSNKASTCDWISLFLNENGVNCMNLNAGMPFAIRQGKFKKFQEGEISVISCTDIVSRGLDTIRARHILNYDFPLNMSDYIHRCGRTGRVGSSDTGHVTNFVSGPLEVEIVQKIELAARKMDLLPNVNANITRIIGAKAMKKMHLESKSGYL